MCAGDRDLDRERLEMVTGGWCSYLCKEDHQAVRVGELQVLGVKVMKCGNVTLNQVPLLIV